MDRRHFLSLLAVPVVAEVVGANLLAACGSSPAATPTTTTTVHGAEGATLLRGTAPRVTLGLDARAAAASIDAFAADLFDRLRAASPRDNLVVSPVSIAIALAMVSGGAKGSTLTQLDSALHITDPATIHQSMNGLTQVLGATTKSKDLAADGGAGTQSVQLDVANSMWLQLDLKVATAYLDLLSSQYGAGIHQVDYRSAAEAARVAINQWASDETHGRIPTVLQQGALTPDTLLTLVNAVYLKANWATPFEATATKPASFTTAAGAKVTVPMMHTGGELPLAKGDGWVATELDYAFDDLAFTVAVGDTPGTVLPTCTEVVSQFSTRLVALAMPKFDTGSSLSLAPTLKAMGMQDAFSDRADFSAITSQAQLFISDVVHVANISVDEAGTVAAAVTAVIMAGSSAPIDPPVAVVLDRPFTFWLREKSTGAIVFMGRVNDPTAA